MLQTYQIPHLTQMKQTFHEICNLNLALEKSSDLDDFIDRFLHAFKKK
jgi:hypothetical protein